MNKRTLNLEVAGAVRRHKTAAPERPFTPCTRGGSLLETLLDRGENAVGRGVKSCLHPSVAKPATHEFALEFFRGKFPGQE